MNRFRISILVLFFAVIGMIVLAVAIQPPPEEVTRSVQPTVVTSLPPVRSHSLISTPTPCIGRGCPGTDGINSALAEGRCPEPDLIPAFMDLNDPADLTGTKLCPKNP